VIGIAPADILSDAYSSVILSARVADRIEVPRREVGNRLYLIFPAGQSAFEPAIFELEPGVAMQQAMLHRGREFVFVLQGHVRLEVGSTISDLHSGDGADYQCSIPNRFSNLSDSEKAAFLIVDAT
jgi:mannose-6-phosphate isomerase-like protein (cupin superfamily)